MTRHLRLLLIPVLAWICGTCIDGPLGTKRVARAQEPSRSSKPEGENRDEHRDHSRGRSFGGDRSGGSRDYRGFRSRSEEDRSGSSGSSTTSSSSASNSSRSSLPAASSASTPTTKPASDNPTSGLNMKDYATRLVKQYDKNGNMMLEPDERKELRGPAAESDLNHDGTITIDELVVHLSAPSQASTSPSPASGLNSTSATNSSGERDRWGSHSHRHDGESTNSDRAKTDADKSLAGRVFTGTAGGISSTTKEGDKRKSYRFSHASDRLPTGLPGWFKSRDANGDAQVSMSEYSRSWSSGTVAEFRRYDLNDDGIITAKEAAKQK